MTTFKNIYCLASALFFAACAYAQLNDPDPLLWILGYLTGGVVLNILVVVDISAAPFLITLFVAGISAVVGYWATLVYPKVDFDGMPQVVAWSILELEEGREIAGLIILLLHALRLKGYGSPRQGIVGGSSILPTLVLTGVLSGAVYMWVYYQPQMNSRYQTEHCSGQFHNSVESTTNEEL
jgi:hypothetical protein